nr:polysaccharide deacetylase family protein [Polynucleobacter necessarius]
MGHHLFACFAAALLLGCFSLGSIAQAAECKKKVYLTFDTGNTSVAEKVAEILRRQNVKATFSWLMRKPFVAIFP